MTLMRRMLHVVVRVSYGRTFVDGTCTSISGHQNMQMLESGSARNDAIALSEPLTHT